MDELREWPTICVVSGMTMARIITGRLEAEDIPTRLRYEAAGEIYAITIDGLGEVRVLVPPSELARARSILARTYEDGELDWEREIPDPAPEKDG